MNPISRVEAVSRIMVVCLRPGPPISKVEYHCPPGLAARSSVLATLIQAAILLRLSVSRRPDYLMAFGLFPHGLMGYLAARISRRRFIPGLISGRVDIECPLRELFPRPRGLMSGFFARLLRRSYAVTTTGTVTRDYLVRIGVEAGRVYPMINPPDLSRVGPLDLPKSWDVLAVARLSPEKNLETFIRAVAMVRRSFGDLKACIVGDGRCQRELAALAHGLGLDDGLVFAGYQTDVARYFNSARVFVLTSRREGFPNVFLEAMACGLPCVVSDCGDIVDLARDGDNALVVRDPEDAAGFARAIEALLSDAGQRERLSRAALETIGRMSPDAVAGQWARVLGADAGLRGDGGPASPDQVPDHLKLFRAQEEPPVDKPKGHQEYGQAGIRVDQAGQGIAAPSQGHGNQ